MIWLSVAAKHGPVNLSADVQRSHWSASVVEIRFDLPYAANAKFRTSGDITREADYNCITLKGRDKRRTTVGCWGEWNCSW